MTILEALNRIDTLLPNAVSQGQKLRWLGQLEGMLQSGILSPREEAAPIVFDAGTALSSQLCAPPPWDAIYLHWLEMQIHYIQGEIPRYNQANAIVRTLWEGFRDHHRRTHLPQGQQIRYF